jgi:hypothetical protein
LRLYGEAFERWQKGIAVRTDPWSQATGGIASEVRARADVLQAEGLFPAADREEYLTNSAVVRGLLLGWCLCEAAKATEGGAS